MQFGLHPPPLVLVFFLSFFSPFILFSNPMVWNEQYYKLGRELVDQPKLVLRLRYLFLLEI